MSNLKWTGFVVDIEATGPIPGEFSMHEIGIVKLDRKLNRTLHLKIEPISIRHTASALGSVNKTFMEILEDEDNIKPREAMSVSRDFILSNIKDGTYPMMFSDNNGFDFMFTHWYFINFLGEDPFGHTSRNIADLFRGLEKNVKANFKRLRDTKHTHNPVDDARGNAEALIKFIDQYGLEGLI